MTCGNCDGKGTMPDGSACTNAKCQGGMMPDQGLGQTPHDDGGMQ